MTDNEYFDWLVSLSSCRFAYSLRTPQQIAEYIHGNNEEGNVTYDPIKNAMKMVVPDKIVIDGTHTGIQSSLIPQVWLPLELQEIGQTIVIWDWFADSSWSKENGFITHKAWMIRKTKRDGDDRFLEPDHDYYDLRTRHSRVRPYTAFGPPPTIKGPFKVYSANGDRVDSQGRYSQYNSDSIGPVLANFYATTEEWVRRMLELNQRADGLVDISFWLCSEKTPITQILNKVTTVMNVADRPTYFAYHLNDSNLRARDGTPEEMAKIEPAYSWGRNVTVHRGVANPIELLKQPLPDFIPQPGGEAPRGPKSVDWRI